MKKIFTYGKYPIHNFIDRTKRNNRKLQFLISSSIDQKIEPCLSNSIDNVPVCTVEMDCFIVFLIMSWYDLFERIEYWVLFGSNYDVSGMFAAVSKRVV